MKRDIPLSSFSHVSDGLNLDERGDYRKALDCYGKGVYLHVLLIATSNIQGLSVISLRLNRSTNLISVT